MCFLQEYDYKIIIDLVNKCNTQITNQAFNDDDNWDEIIHQTVNSQNNDEHIKVIRGTVCKMQVRKLIKNGVLYYYKEGRELLVVIESCTPQNHDLSQ